MKSIRTSIWLWTLPVVSLALSVGGCSGKKDKGNEPAAPAAPAAEQTWKFNPCPVARIEVNPSKSEDQGVTIGSNAEVKLTATAYDASGNPLNVPLVWRFRHPDTCGINTAGGHQLTVTDSNHAVFRASGLAEGDFLIIVEDQGCNCSDPDHPQYVEGLAWVRVYNRPGAEASCGRMRITYGDEIDRVGERVMASSKVRLLAEVAVPPKNQYKYRVRFYLNDKAMPELQPLYNDVNLEPQGEARRYKAMLPIYLVPGDHCVKYELLKGKEVVCGSGTERFTAR